MPKIPPTATFVLLSLLAALPAQGHVNASILQPARPTAAELARRQTPGANAVARARDAVVHVFVWVEKGKTSFKIERPSSGVIVDPSGLVVTNWDLVCEALDGNGGKASNHTLKVRLRGGKEHQAKIVAKHLPSGLALLQFDAGDGQLTWVELADSKRVAPGEPTTVLSYPEGKDNIVFAGVAVRACGGTTVGNEKLGPEDILLSDAAIRRENHGGALLDADGRLLGICNASHVGRDLQEPTVEDLRKPSFGFVLPATAIRKAFRACFQKAKVRNRTLLAPPKATAEEETRRLAGAATAVAKVVDSIVGVYGGDGKRPPIGNMDPYATRRRSKLGSGVIIDTSGLVLTNAHLVAGKDEVGVTLRSGRSVRAAVLDNHRGTNVALLKMKLPAGTKVQAIQLGDSKAVIPGETVVGVGRPYSPAALTVSAGILSASRSRRRVTLGKQKETGLWLQADPNLADHNGGGALIDMTGRLIGIVDGGRVDRLEMAVARAKMTREDQKLQTNLSFVPGINRIRKQFRALLDEHAGNNDSVARPAAMTKKDLALRSTPVADVVSRTAGCLVNVYVSWTSKQADVEDNPFAQRKPRVFTRGLGSGVIISKDGLALTNWHVVDSATKPTGEMRPDHVVHVKRRDGRQFETQVLSISREDDLALLQLKLRDGETVDCVELGDSDALQEGETVIAIGNPHGQQNTATCGIVTAKNQGIRVRRRWAKFEGLIQTDAAINAGNSGGALLDINGKLIGINSAGGRVRSISSYAIPVNYVREKLLGVLLTPKKLRSIYTGMALGDKDGHPVVTAAHRYGPARRAGIRAGDQLLELDGQALTWSVGLATELLKRTADQPLTFKVQRESKKLAVKVAPWSAPTWAVFQQAGMECAALPYQKDPDLVRDACLAVHRKFTGDPQAEPRRIPRSVVRVVGLHPGVAEEGAVEVGDLVMAVKLSIRGAAGVTETLERFRVIKDLQDCF
ncbi:MAG: S1C family serine protease, partial [Planctomycetota bacterium]